MWSWLIQTSTVMKIMKSLQHQSQEHKNMNKWNKHFKMLKLMLHNTDLWLTDIASWIKLSCFNRQCRHFCTICCCFCSVKILWHKRCCIRRKAKFWFFRLLWNTDKKYSPTHCVFTHYFNFQSFQYYAEVTKISSSGVLVVCRNIKR